MDRENRWDRVQKAYNLLVYGVAEKEFCSGQDALKESYSVGVYDEFVEPTKLSGFEKISDNDAVIYFNYRTDRARELTQAMVEDFSEFPIHNFKNLKFCSMTEYSSDFKNVLVAFPPEKIQNNLSAIVSANGLNQFHVTETTKYAHVTFFFNGGIEKSYKNEERMLVDSYNVKNFAEFPQMKAPEITKETINAIKSHKYDFILVNLSNPDMIGHTGDLDATVKAIDVIDKCAFDIANACLEESSHCIITADHGNAEEMMDKNGNVVTSHTTNPVPLWLVSDKYKDVTLNKGKLSNVAPTVLKLLGLEKPDDMEDSLF